MIFRSHLLSMIIYAFFVCTVLAMIRRKERKDQIKYGIILFSIMVAGSILFGWLMYLFF
jgi:heme A synthase